MTRKKRVSVSRMQPLSYSQMYKDQKAEPVVEERTPVRRRIPAEAAPPAPKGSESVNWQGEYGYVFNDLRRLLSITALLFAVLIVSGFFL